MAAGASSPLAHLARLGGQAAIGLSEGALAFAALHGDSRGVERLASLTAGLDVTAGLEPLATRLSGFHLDEDDAAQWPEVVAHGGGTPAALAMVWLEVARRAGWIAEALDFPGFLPVRLTDGAGTRVIVDPTAGGVALEVTGLRATLKALEGAAAELRPALFVALSNRNILLRQQHEIKLRALANGRIAQALAAVEGILAFAPEQVALWREAGMMHLRLGAMAGAITALEQFAARTANGAARRRTQQLLHDLRARLS